MKDAIAIFLVEEMTWANKSTTPIVEINNLKDLGEKWSLDYKVFFTVNGDITKKIYPYMEFWDTRIEKRIIKEFLRTRNLSILV
jgi:hypothetical protein